MSILFLGRELNAPSQLWMRRQLHALGSDVNLVATTQGSANDYRNTYKVIELLSHDSWLLEKGARHLTVLRLRHAINSKDVSRVFIHYATDAVLYRKSFLNSDVPVFVHCHGYDVTWGHTAQDVGGAPFRTHRTSYIDDVLKLQDRVEFIANSHRTKQRLLEIGVKQEKIHVKYLGVPVPDKPPEIDEQVRPLNVLYLGRLIDFKGPDLVIRAFELACENGFNGKLILAGGGPLEMTCALLCAHSRFRDQIELLGPVDAERGEALRQEADIFTAHNCTGPLSGQEEAFGVSIIEAMAAGIPIVNAANGSIPELVDDGREAILFEPGDIAAHAAAFLSLYHNPVIRSEMGKCGWKRALDSFSIQSETRMLRKILGI